MNHEIPLPLTPQLRAPRRARSCSLKEKSVVSLEGSCGRRFSSPSPFSWVFSLSTSSCRAIICASPLHLFCYVVFSDHSLGWRGGSNHPPEAQWLLVDPQAPASNVSFSCSDLIYSLCVSPNVNCDRLGPFFIPSVRRWPRGGGVLFSATSFMSVWY